jgi:hypothetical protein
MPISQILITDTIDFGRQVINQITTAINNFGGGANLTSNVTVNPVSRTDVSLNVGSGLIRGNGASIFGLDSNNVTTGLFLNSQLQNSSITIVSANGINGTGTLSLGSSILLNVMVVDAISNNRANLIASANSITWVNQIVSALASNASFPNTGILPTSLGGTGRSTMPAGQILIGNTLSGGLEANTIWAGPGVRVDTFSQGMVLTANVIQGSNVDMSVLPGGGVSIGANGPPTATSSTLGLVRLNDTVTGRSITDQVGTANSVNAVHKLYSQFGVLSSAPGRLIDVAVFKTPGAPATWTKRPNTDFIHLILIGGGGSGASNANATNAATESQGTYHYFGGFAGAMCEAFIANSNVGSTMTVTVGWGGNAVNLSHSTIATGRPGGNSFFSNGTIIYQANGGPGGIGFASQKNYNTTRFEALGQGSPRAGFGGSSGLNPVSFLEVPGEPPSPIYAIYHSFPGSEANVAGVFLTGANAGNGAVIGSSGGSVPGYCLGGQYIPVLCSGPTRHLGNTIYSGQSVLGPGGNGGRDESGTYLGSNSQFSAGPTNSTPSNQGSGFGGGGGAGGWHAKFNDIAQGASPEVVTAYARGGASGANGLCIVLSYSNQ